MLEGPIGGAAFNNEFGRPQLCGYFRTFEQSVGGRAAAATTSRSWSPAAWATSRATHVAQARRFPPGAADRQLGGPAMLIGLGGGAASSHGDRRQRGGPRLRLGAARQRRDAAALPGGDRPLLALGDGEPHPERSTTSAPAACPTRCPSWSHGGGAARASTCAQIPNEEPGMSAACEIWCNEAQERYVLAIAPEDRDRFRAICARERCPFAVLGEATARRRSSSWRTPHFGNRPIDMDLDVLLGKPPQMLRDVAHAARGAAAARPRRRRPARGRVRACCASRRWPTRRSSITIGDRTVGGLVRARPDGRARGRCRSPTWR